jgi:Na+/melibiose symporter-like transporter
MRFGSGISAVLGHRDVRLLLVAGLVSQTGDWALRIGVGFQVYALTGSTVASAVIMLVSLAPQVLLGSFAGACVDRWDRRRTMVVVNLALAVVLAPLVVAPDEVVLIYAVLAVSSCLTPFFLIADATMLPALVPDGPLRITANALNSQVRDVSRLIGAALGGVLVSAGGVAALAVADIVTFLLAAAAIAALRHRFPPAPTRQLRLRDELVEGSAAIRHSRALVVVLVFLAATGVGEAIMGTLFAPFVHDLLAADAGVFGLIVSAQAVGGIAGGVVISLIGHRFRARTLFGWGAVGFGLLDLALFLYPVVFRSVTETAPPTWPAMVIIAAVGLPGAALVAGFMTTLQNHTTDRVRGRVFGTVTAAQNATMLVATLLAGFAADTFGIVPLLSVQGALHVVAGVVVVHGLRQVPDGSTMTETATVHA